MSSSPSVESLRTAPTMPSASSAGPDQAQGFIDRQLARAAAQIRLFDLLGGVLLWCTAVLGLLIAIAVIDAWILPLGMVARWLVLLGLVTGSIGFLGYRLAPLLMRRINPMYAARMLDEGHPELKDGLINVLSLRGQPGLVRQRIMALLTRRTASDLSQLRIDNAIDRSYVIRVGYVLASLMALAAGYKILSPKDPLTTLKRIAVPSADVPPPSRVRINEVTPGDATVRFGETLAVEAEIDGLSDQSTAVIRYSTDDQQAIEATQTMTWDEASRRYRATLSPSPTGIEGSLSYTIEAGDARSPSYRVEVASRPTSSIERVTLRPQSYTELPERTWTDRGDFEGLEGTEVELVAKANVPIDKLVLELLATGSRSSTGEEKDRPAAKRIPFTVDGNQGTVKFRLELGEDRITPKYDAYRVQLLTTSGEIDSDPVHYRIAVFPDLAPSIRWVAPEGRELRLGMEQRLELETEAFDADFHISKVQLIGEVRGNRILTEQLLDASRTPDDRHIGRLRFQPNNYRLKPGDTVVLYAEAQDDRHHPLSRQLDPNLAQTERIVIQIEAPRSEGNSGNSGGSGGGAPSDGANPTDGGQGDNNSNNNGGDSANTEGGETAQGENDSPSGGSGGSGGSPEQSPDGMGESDPQSGSGSGGSGQASQSSDDPSQGGGGNSTNSGDSNESGSTPGDNATESPASGGNPGQSGTGGQSTPSTGGDETATDATGESGTGETGSNTGERSATSSEPSSADPNEATPENGGSDSSSNGNEGSDSSAPPRHEGEAFDRILERLRREGKTDSLDQNQGGGSSQDQGQSTPAGNENRDPNNGGTSSPNENSGDDERGTDSPSDGASGTNDTADTDPGSNDPSGNPDQGGNESNENEPSSSDPRSGQQNGGGSAEQNPGNSATPEPGAEGSSGDQESATGETGPRPEGGADSSNNPMGQSNSGEQSGTGDDPNASPRRPEGGESEGSESEGASGADETGANDSGGNETSGSDGTGESNDPASGSNDSGSPETSDGSPMGANADGSNDGNDGGSTSNPTTGNEGATEGSPETGSTSGNRGANESSGGASGDMGADSEGSESDSGSEGETGTEGNPGSSAEGDRGQASGEAPNSANPANSNAPPTGARPGDRERTAPRSTPIEGELPPSEAANLEYARQATDLVLDYLKDQEGEPDPELLRELDWTPEQLQQFIKRWEQMRSAADQGGVSERRQLDERLRSLGLLPPGSDPRRIRHGSDAVQGLGQDGARTAPPPEFAEKFRLFLRGVSQAESDASRLELNRSSSDR